MLRRLFNDPIFRFLLGGIFIFIVYTTFSDPDQNQSYLITLDDGKIARLKSAWQTEKGRVPTEETLINLIHSEIREEILYREARRLGLDKDDRVIKRRLVQKYRFMLDDAIIVPEPDIEALKEYHQSHPEQYRTAGTVSFEHIFFSNANRVDPQGDAATALLRRDRLQGHSPKQHPGGDSFMGPMRLENYQKRMVRRVFGYGFFDRLTALQTGTWSTPIESAYGWHLVNLHDRQDARQLSFEASQEKILKDLRQLKRLEAKKKMFNKLVSKYRIQTPASAPAIDLTAIGKP